MVGKKRWGKSLVMLTCTSNSTLYSPASLHLFFLSLAVSLSLTVFIHLLLLLHSAFSPLSTSLSLSLSQVAGWVVTAHQCWVEQGPTAPKAGTKIMQYHTHAHTQTYSVFSIIRMLAPHSFCMQDVWSYDCFRDRWRYFPLWITGASCCFLV